MSFLYDRKADISYSDKHDSHPEQESEELGDVLRVPVAAALRVAV
jgi:uncharacterized protein YuzE